MQLEYLWELNSDCNFWLDAESIVLVNAVANHLIYIYIYVCVCVCVCMCAYVY